MNKSVLFILFFLSVSTSFSQSIAQGSETSISITENGILTVDDASFSGLLSNEGDIFINEGVDFASNEFVGNVTFSGSTISVVSGNNLYFSQLTTNSSADIVLTADSIFTDKLTLKAGVIVSGFTYFKSLDEIEGGSDLSHIEGTLVIEKQRMGNQIFPLGKNGFYNPITLQALPNQSITSIKLGIPDPTHLFPADSVIGIDGEYEWIIDYSGEQVSSLPTIQFQNVNLNELPNRREIRAPIYQPGIVLFDSLNTLYRSLGAGLVEDSDNSTFGIVQSLFPITLNGQSIRLGIGLFPAPTELQFYVPNVFSPLAQLEKNKLFKPFLDGTKIISLKITLWDQFNNQVFSEYYEDPNMSLVGWNGENNGKESPEGVYYYDIELVSQDGDFIKKGTVFLAR